MTETAKVCFADKLLNLALTVSNVGAFGAALAFQSDKIAQFLILFAGLASIFYHSVEQGKHSMPGLWGDPCRHKNYLLCDRLGAAALCCYLFLSVRPLKIAYFVPLIFLVLSEIPWKLYELGYCKALSRHLVMERYWYAFWHMIWHLHAFQTAFDIAVSECLSE